MAEKRVLLENYLTTNDMEKIFEVTYLTIYNWRTRNSLPYYEVAGDARGSVRFDPKEVAEWAKLKGKVVKNSHPLWPIAA